MAENGTIQVNVKGATRVHLNTDASGAWSYLGFTRDGVMITPESYWIEVKSDDNGGEAGPPSEIQYVGETSRIRCELTKFDPTNAELIQLRLNPKTTFGSFPVASSDSAVATGQVGQVPPAGTMVFANKVYFSVCLEMMGVAQFDSDTAISALYRIYPRCLPRHGVEFNAGTKYSTFVVEFEAFKSNNGILFWESASMPSAYNA
jgi:hypothetical protein